MVKDILQRLPLYLVGAKIKESIFQHEKDKDKDSNGESNEEEVIKKMGVERVQDHILSPIKRETPSFEAQDTLIEVNLGIADESH